MLSPNVTGTVVIKSKVEMSHPPPFVDALKVRYDVEPPPPPPPKEDVEKRCGEYCANVMKQVTSGLVSCGGNTLKAIKRHDCDGTLTTMLLAATVPLDRMFACHLIGSGAIDASQYESAVCLTCESAMAVTGRVGSFFLKVSDRGKDVDNILIDAVNAALLMHDRRVYDSLKGHVLKHVISFKTWITASADSEGKTQQWPVAAIAAGDEGSGFRKRHMACVFKLIMQNKPLSLMLQDDDAMRVSTALPELYRSMMVAWVDLGMTHNDLHPGNILYDVAKERFVLIDYGRMYLSAYADRMDVVRLVTREHSRLGMPVNGTGTYAMMQQKYGNGNVGVKSLVSPLTNRSVGWIVDMIPLGMNCLVRMDGLMRRLSKLCHSFLDGSFRIPATCKGVLDAYMEVVTTSLDTESQHKELCNMVAESAMLFGLTLRSAGISKEVIDANDWCNHKAVASERLFFHTFVWIGTEKGMGSILERITVSMYEYPRLKEVCRHSTFMRCLMGETDMTGTTASVSNGAVAAKGGGPLPPLKNAFDSIDVWTGSKMYRRLRLPAALAGKTRSQKKVRG